MLAVAFEQGLQGHGEHWNTSACGAFAYKLSNSLDESTTVGCR